MGATDIFGQAWSLYKANWQRLIAISLIVAVVVAILSAVLINLGAAGLFAAAIVSAVGYFIVQATLTGAAADMRDGRVDLSLGETFARSAPRFAAAAAAGILVVIAVAIAVGILTSIAGIAGLVLPIIPAVLLLTLWAVLIPSIVLENKGVLEGFGRSQQLTTRNFGLSLAVVALTILVSIVVGIILSIVTAPVNATVQELVSNLVNLGFVTPFIVVCWTLLYFTLAQPTGPPTTDAT